MAEVYNNGALSQGSAILARNYRERKATNFHGRALFVYKYLALRRDYRQHPAHMTSTDEAPPNYRLSLPPGVLSRNLWLIVDYLDDRPSISLTGVIANADGDVSTPPSGRGVVVRDLRDFDARRRFGAFGRTFVELERLRQSRSKEEANRTSTEKFVRMYNVTLHAVKLTKFRYISVNG
jgi:hypothetical protein